MCRLPLLLRSRGTKAYRATPGISPGHPGRACFETHKAVPLPDIFPRRWDKPSSGYSHMCKILAPLVPLGGRVEQCAASLCCSGAEARRHTGQLLASPQDIRAVPALRYTRPCRFPTSSLLPRRRGTPSTDTSHGAYPGSLWSFPQRGKRSAVTRSSLPENAMLHAGHCSHLRIGPPVATARTVSDCRPKPNPTNRVPTEHVILPRLPR